MNVTIHSLGVCKNNCFMIFVWIIKSICVDSCLLNCIEIFTLLNVVSEIHKNNITSITKCFNDNVFL